MQYDLYVRWRGSRTPSTRSSSRRNPIPRSYDIGPRDTKSTSYLEGLHTVRDRDIPAVRNM